MIYNNIHNKNANSVRNLLFKGYFACPLKRVHVQSSTHIGDSVSVARQLDQIGSQVGFDTFFQYGSNVFKTNSDLTYNFVASNLKGDIQIGDVWGQDNKIFLGKDVLGILTQHRDSKQARKLKEALGIKSKNIESSLVGGNFFLGVKPDGTQFALIGEDSLFKTAKYINKTTSKNWDNFDPTEKQKYLEKAKSKIAKELELDPKQINYIPQPDYHLDVGIRPLKYPHILVNDPDLVLEEVKKIKDISPRTVNIMEEDIKTKKEKCQEKGYISPKNMEKLLTSLGFKVTRVPGSFYEEDKCSKFRTSANYMNAIVHQKKDGSLVYMAPKSKPFYKYDFDFDNIFKNYLLKTIPEIKKVEFIDIGNTLQERGGALHCMTAEEPDFEIYRKMAINHLC